MKLEVETDKTQWILVPTFGWFKEGGYYPENNPHVVLAFAWLIWTIRLNFRKEKK